MDVKKRLFPSAPPREPLTSIAAVVRDWKWRFGEGAKHAAMRDEVVAFCGEAPDFAAAVDRAVRSRRPNGKMHNHQSRVPLAILLDFGARILAEQEELTRVGFDALYDRLAAIKPPGIGPVTAYDVATRIGAFLSVEPESLYLHAGVREGWKAMTGDPARGETRLPRERWPEELRNMPADEVEDFLCTYRDCLADIRNGTAS